MKRFFNFIYYLLTKSKVITGESQTKALMYHSVNTSRPILSLVSLNDLTDEVNKLFIITYYGLFIMDLSLQSIKTNHWSVDNLKKHVTSMNDTGQWIPGGFLTAVNRP